MHHKENPFSRVLQTVIDSNIKFQVVKNFYFSHYFTLAPTGFLSKENLDYTVVEVPGAKQQELYDNVLKSINSFYSNPKDGLTLVPGQAITLAAYKNRGLKHLLASRLFTIMSIIPYLFCLKMER